MAQRQPQKYVIRAQHLGRKVLLEERPTTLCDAVRRAHRNVAGSVERDGKEYEMRVAEARVTFNGYSWRGCKRGQRPKKGTPLPVRVVMVQVCDRGHRAHQWVLLTNLEEPAERVAQIYTWRWRIKRLFFLIKVGIHMPLWGEQSGERIARRLAVSSLAAMAIYQLQSPPPDPVKIALIKRIATIGGWYGRETRPDRSHRLDARHAALHRGLGSHRGVRGRRPAHHGCRACRGPWPADPWGWPPLR